MTFLIVLLSSAGAQDPDPGAVGGQPMMRWTVWATETLDRRISYEGAPDGMAEGSITPDVRAVDPVGSAVAALAASPFPVRFASRAVDGREVIVPTATLGANGSWSAYTPLLDTRIDLPAGTRDINQALSEWAAALEARTGQRIVDITALSGDSTTAAYGDEVVARDLLIEILDDHSRGIRGPNLIWMLVSDGSGGWILNLRRVWRLETPPGQPVWPPPQREQP